MNFFRNYWPEFVVACGAVVLCGLAAACRGQELSADMQETIRRDEICRMGDCVATAGTGLEGQDEASVFAEAMAYPTNEQDKWFVNLICTDHCKACEQLKKDFGNSKHLRAFAHPESVKTSPSNYNVYDRKSQVGAWPFSHVPVSGYPAVVISPPLSGKYGPPTNFLKPIIGYNGDPKALAAKLRTSMKAYVKTYDARQVASSDAAGGKSYVDENPFPDDDSEPDAEPQIDWPEDEPDTWGESIGLPSWLALLWAHGEIANTVFLVLGGLRLYREYRKRQGLPLLVDPAKLDKLLAIVERLTGTQPTEQRG